MSGLQPKAFYRCLYSFELYKHIEPAVKDGLCNLAQLFDGELVAGSLVFVPQTFGRDVVCVMHQDQIGYIRVREHWSYYLVPVDLAKEARDTDTYHR